MDDIRKQLNVLMEEWKASHKNKGLVSFISDGAVNVEAYVGSKLKICYFLKEAYSKDNDEDWDLAGWLDSGAMTRMWSNVAEWTYGILSTTTTNIAHKPQLTNQEKTALLRSVSVVNVKKSNGKVQSDYDDLLSYASEDKEFLKRELEILNPDVIVCGNISSLLRLLYGATVQSKNGVSAEGLIDAEYLSKNGYAFAGKQIIIDYYHPANHYPSMLNYYTICSLYQQALKMKG